MKPKTLALGAILAALALALGILERFVPLSLLIPLPGLKLGLANVVTLFALYVLEFRYVAAIVLIRCLLGGVFGSGVTSLLFSLAGGLLSLGTMAICRRCRRLSVYGVSVLGAAAHSIGQVICAILLLGSWRVLYYLPPLLAVSAVCGLVTAAAAGGVLRVFFISPFAGEFCGREVV